MFSKKPEENFVKKVKSYTFDAKQKNHFQTINWQYRPVYRCNNDE